MFVDTLIPGRVPAFEEVEADVKKAWLAEQKAQAWQKAYQDMRAKYTVLLPAPADDAHRQAATCRRVSRPRLVARGPLVNPWQRVIGWLLVGELLALLLLPLAAIGARVAPGLSRNQ